MKKEVIIWKVTSFILFLALALTLYAGYVQAAQTHMQTALSSLQTARTALQTAEHDKGGHRAKALGFINSAIAEVELGIRAGAGK